MTLADQAPFVPDDLDARLGPAASRYFATGYRRIGHRVEHLAAVDDGPAPATGSARVHYPSDWSAKNGVARAPHLSTLDALVLTYGVVEGYLRVLGLDDDQVARAWFERVSVRAGARPQTDLGDVRLELRAAPLPSDLPPADGSRSALECRVGQLVVVVVVRHEAPAGPGTGWDEATRQLARRSVGGALFRRTGHRTRITELDLTEQQVRSEHWLDPVAERPDGGLEAAYWPSATLVDALVLTGQLGQVLLYSAAGIDRDQADTLWMRRMTFEVDAPVRPTGGWHGSEVRIVGHRTFAHDGRRLHDVQAHCPGLAGVRATAWLAYYDDAGAV